MPRFRYRAAVLPTLLLSLGCSAHVPPPGAREASLLREAEAFMESYAEDLRAGERERIAARYDHRGAYIMGMGRKELRSPAALHARYTGPWRAPTSFQWRDLSYEVVGPDAVVVVGQFLWGGTDPEPILYSYTGLLVRRDGRLRIRLEDESTGPRPCPPCAPPP